MSAMQERGLHADRRPGRAGTTGRDDAVAMPGLFGETPRDPRPVARQAVPTMRKEPGVPAADVVVKDGTCATYRHYFDKPVGSRWRRCLKKQTIIFSGYENCREWEVWT
jgi:hypothetical protein